MTFDAARKQAATLTGKNLSTAEVTSLLTQMEELIGRRPDEIVGPNLRLRWHEEHGTYTLKLLPTVSDSGHLVWNLGYSNHRDDTLQKREHAVLTEEMFDEDVRAAMPYLWMVTNTPGEPTPIPSWAQLVNNLGRAIGELPATLAVLPTSWIGESAHLVDHKLNALDVYATRNGLRARVRGTEDKEGPAEDVALVIDPVAALEAGSVFGWAYGSAYDLGTPLESIDLTLDMPGAAAPLRPFQVWPEINDENRLDSNVMPNYHSRSYELLELATWTGPVDADFPADLPRPFGSTDTGKFGVVVSEAEQAKARARARQQRTINIRNAAAAEAARGEGASTTAMADDKAPTAKAPRWKFWSKGA